MANLAENAHLQQPSETKHFTPVFQGAKRWKYLFAAVIWLALIVVFWSWWLDPDNRVSPLKYGVATGVLAWLSFLQFYFISIALRAVKPSASLEGLRGARVAMVVTKTPSEPFEVVERTLRAMLAQEVDHDTWLADEDPTPEVEAWCAEQGVQISTRRGVADYHRDAWPRRTRCKEGNLAYFYDVYGYDRYDFVVQMDADHSPEPGYLREMLRPFADSDVGYVSAPSMCARNTGSSWAARARMYSEGLFHGALQSGYTNRWAPMCIGSHYAVRTSALREVGGLGPELAEDHSTSLIFNAGGWRGAHAVDALAIGDGPATFPDMIRQEFQWSRSLVTLLLKYTPQYLDGLSPRLRFQFLFSEIWYPVFGILMALTFAMPIWALATDERFADVTFPEFVLHSAPPATVLIWIAYQLRSDGLSRPPSAKVISWERTLFPLAQWPWVLSGSLIAVLDALRGGFVDFKVTPKGGVSEAPLPYRVLLPSFVLAVASSLSVILIQDVRAAGGFYLFAAVNGALYSLLFTIIIWKHNVENSISLRSRNFVRLGAQTVAVMCLLVLNAEAFEVRGMQGLYSITTGLGEWQFVQAKSVVSGAGSGPPGTLIYVFDFDD